MVLSTNYGKQVKTELYAELFIDTFWNNVVFGVFFTDTK